MKKGILVLLLTVPFLLNAQIPDHIYQENIRSVKLYKSGDIYSYPVLSLNGADQLELHFDDMDADMKNYYYTYQLCNADWSPADLQPFSYINGFQSNRISTYRYSSIVPNHYTHYTATLPDRSSRIIRSGNYLLKVYINDDTSKLAFTKRFLVADNRAQVTAQILEPFNSNYFRTHQRVFAGVNLVNANINNFTPQDIKLTIVQNYAWVTSTTNDHPTIFRGNYLEYSEDDNSTFQAGKAWRWINLRSLRLMSDRMARLVDTDKKRTDVYVKPDVDRRQQLVANYQDMNGLFTIENLDGTNPLWQSDYAYVHFTYVPPGNQAYLGKDIYLFGELTGYGFGEKNKMEFNQDKGVYEKTLYLKQGFYNYTYVALSQKDPGGSSFDLGITEGNYYGTFNTYMLLVYYRAFGSRADELIGYTRLSSVFQ